MARVGGGQTLPVLLLFLSVVFGRDLAANPLCVRALTAREQWPMVAERLTDLPRIAPLVERLWFDPTMPAHLKTVVRTAVLVRDAKIIALTPELRTRLNLSDEFEAFYADRLSLNMADARTMARLTRPWFRKLWPDWRARRGPVISSGRNARVQMQTDRTMLGQLAPAVFVQNRSITRYENDFLSLLHELAHLRFNHFLSTHVEQLLRVLPPYFLWRSTDGAVYVDRAFVDFLAERYCLEIEISLVARTQYKYFGAQYVPYAPFTYALTPAEIRTRVAHQVVVDYELKDPRVRRLAKFSLAEILRGRPFR